MSKDLITFHPHAWGADESKRLNKARNSDEVPDAYHQAIIMRNAADYAAKKMAEKINRDYHPRVSSDKALGVSRDASGTPLPTGFAGCAQHMFNPNSLACMLCGATAESESQW